MIDTERMGSMPTSSCLLCLDSLICDHFNFVGRVNISSDEPMK